MRIFNKKNETFQDESNYNSQLSDQAKRLGLSVPELKDLSVGKSCPKYGTAELLHARKVRGGKVVVFNISERYRGEKISEGRKKINAQRVSADTVANEDNKK